MLTRHDPKGLPQFPQSWEMSWTCTAWSQPPGSTLLRMALLLSRNCYLGQPLLAAPAYESPGHQSG